MAEDYGMAVTAARAWKGAAEDALVSGAWRPTQQGRAIAGDLSLATKWPSAKLPPHDDEPLF